MQHKNGDKFSKNSTTFNWPQSNGYTLDRQCVHVLYVCMCCACEQDK